MGLGVGSALMIVSGYYGELTVTGDLTPRWICWFISMAFFLYIVQELLVGLSEATEREADRDVKDKIKSAQLVHIPCRVPLPDVGHLGLQGRGRHPGGLLCLGHHLEVWCGLVHLPDFLCQVEAGEGMSEEHLRSCWSFFGGLARQAGLCTRQACRQPLSRLKLCSRASVVMGAFSS